MNTDDKQAMTDEILERLRPFYTESECQEWLHARHPLLNGDSANEVIHRGDGQRVLDVIAALESGVYL